LQTGKAGDCLGPQTSRGPPRGDTSLNDISVVFILVFFNAKFRTTNYTKNTIKQTSYIAISLNQIQLIYNSGVPIIVDELHLSEWGNAQRLQ